MIFQRLPGGRKTEFSTKMEAYLQYIREAMPQFEGGLDAYLRADQIYFDHCLSQLNRIEKDADELLRSISSHIYTQMLYPSMQKDICKLLNTLDDIVDTTKQVMIQVDIENPVIPDFLKMNFLELVRLSCRAVNEVSAGTGCFFRNSVLVEDHVNKVMFYEKEADKMEQAIKIKTHGSGSIPGLSQRNHLCHFAEKIAMPSDKAYRVAKDLIIYTINKESHEKHFMF